MLVFVWEAFMMAFTMNSTLEQKMLRRCSALLLIDAIYPFAS
jgi:hypothetical protein